MGSFECYDCSDTFALQDLSERICCRRRLCSKCLKDTPECHNCPNIARIEVNLEQLQQEIIRVNEVQQEQVEFYFKYGHNGKSWNLDMKAAFDADAKAIQLHLELLLELQERLTSLQDHDKTVLIPEGILVRSKDYQSCQLVDSEGILVARDLVQQQFFDQHKIYHAWEGISGRNMPPTGRYCKRLNLSPGQISISGLVNMPLEFFRGSRSMITDLTALTGRPAATLVELDLHCNIITDLTALAGLKTLRILNLSMNRIVDISPLAGLAPTLTELDLSYNSVVDISPLQPGSALTILDLSGNDISDITVLAGMALTKLNLSFTKVVDITVLRGQPLTKLVAVYSKIRDFSPVAEIPGLEIMGD